MRTMEFTFDGALERVLLMADGKRLLWFCGAMEFIVRLSVVS